MRRGPGCEEDPPVRVSLYHSDGSEVNDVACCCRDRSRAVYGSPFPDHGSEDQAREREKGDEVGARRGCTQRSTSRKDHAVTVYQMANAETAALAVAGRAVESQRRPVVTGKMAYT